MRKVPQLNPDHPGMAIFSETGAADRGLRAGDVIRQFDRSFHFVQYVNSSGAYVVPLSAITRMIVGQEVAFTAGGKTISARSGVEIVNPLAMGGNSPEYARYVRMVRSLEEGGDSSGARAMAKRKATGPAVSLSDFDPEDMEPIDLTGGHEVGLESETPAIEGEEGMAKKAKSGKAKAAKREKATKTVRNCVCGCGTETTGYFAPGHDARYHGWVKKLADGRIQRNGKDAKSGEQVIGASVLNKMGLVAKGDGFKANTPEFYKD